MRKLKSVLSIVLVLCMLLSTIPVATAEETTVHNITIEANGVVFRVDVTGTESSWETGSCDGAMSTGIASGKSLTDVGVIVSHDTDHEAHLIGWQVLLPVEQNGEIVPTPAMDENGNELRLTTAKMLAYPIVEDTIFIPLWDSSKYTSLYWLTIHGNGGTFERTTEDSEKTEVRQMGYDSYPTADSGATLKSIGILNLTDPVCEGKEFEGWVAYHHGPTDTEFSVPVTGEVLTTEYILDYASLGLGYTDFIAKWKNEAIDPNNCPIDDTDILISSTPVDSAPTTYEVTIDACMGAPFNISAPPPLGNDEPSSYIGEATLSVEDGKTLAELGIEVWHDDEHLPYFKGWTISTWDPTEEWWVSKTDSDGNLVVLDTATMLATPITEDVRFEPSWETYTVIFEDVDGGTFDQVDPYSGDIYRDDCSKAGYSVSYWKNLEDFAVITDIKNGSETFYGWDVYESVEDPNNPETTTLIPLAGPISTEEVLARTITHDMVCRANWTGNAPGDNSGGVPGESAPTSGGLAISSDGTFDIYRTNPQNGQVELWGDDASHTREVMDVYVGDTLADFGITDITDIKFWDGKREFLGWEAWSNLTVEAEWGSYQEWGILYNRLFTTQEMLNFPAEEEYIEFVAVWAGDDEDYYTTIDFDAVGGQFPITKFDYTENGAVAVGTELCESIGNQCKKTDQPYAEQWESNFYPVGDPVREGYTFEGWLAINWNNRAASSTKLYTTEEIVKLPIPADDTTYMAKWKEISMDEYLYGYPHTPYDGSYSELYLLANGSTFNCSVSYEENGETVTDTFQDSWPIFYTEGDMTFQEFQGEYGMPGYTFELADKTNFEGWTTYSADRIYSAEILKGEKLNVTGENLTVFYAGENEYPSADGSETIYTESYLLLKNAKVYSTTMTPEEALKLKGDKFYATVAQWHEASATLANVKAATCTAEGYTGDKVCAKCGEILEKGKVIDKIAHTLTKVAAVAPTYTAGGNIEYYACACGALFLDAQGKTATTAEAVKLAQLVKINETEAKAEVSTDAVDTAIKEAETTGSITIDLVEIAEEEAAKPESGSGSDTTAKPAPVVSSAALPVASLEKVSKINEEATLTVNMTEVTVTMDSKTMAAVAEQSAGETVTLKVEKVETKTLTEEQQAVIEDKEVAVVITATMISNNTAISDFKGGEVTIAIPFTLPEGTQGSDFQVYYVADDGTMTAHDTAYENGCLVFSTGHFSDYVVVNNAKPADPTVPNTGDQSQLMFFTTMLLISAAALYFASRKLRRA